MIEQRSAGDLATAWRVFVAALMPLIQAPETDADDAWPTSTHDRDIVERWLWETMGDMVRLAYGVDFDRGVSIIVREMKTAFGLSVQYDQRGTLGTRRRLSTVAWLAIERQDSESFEAVVEVYESTALDGLNSDDAVMFGQAVLGLGHLAETTVALAPPPQAVISRNNPEAFQRPFAPASHVAGRLMDLGYRLGQSQAWPAWHLLKDAVALGFDAAVPADMETAAAHLRTMKDLAISAAKSGQGETADHTEWLATLVSELGAMASSLNDAPEGLHLKRCWDSLASVVVEGCLLHLRRQE